jgi:hemoglobin-like flavoprotein
MTDNQIHLVQSSFQALAPEAEAVANTFYNRLFTLQPTLRLMFPLDLTDQKRKLMATLQVAISSLTKLDVLIPALTALGRKHAEYGVRDEHYNLVGAALLWTLEQHLKGDFDAEVETAWSEMYKIVSGKMIEAAHELHHELNALAA